MKMKLIITSSLLALAVGGCEFLDEPGLGNEQSRDQEGVVLRGDVEEVYASGAFRFDPEEGLVNNDSVLVVRGEKDLAEVRPGSEATVEGEVQQFEDVADFEEAHGMPLTEELLEQLDAPVFVIARRVTAESDSSGR